MARAHAAVNRRALFASLYLAATCAFAQSVVTETTFSFAPAAETRRALVADDDWMNAVSAFQRAATVGKPEPVSKGEFKTFLAAAAVECSRDEMDRWSAAIKKVAPKFDELQLRLPAQVVIACTSGADAAGAPYTRGNTVFLPRGLKAPSDIELMAHELFHIWSRNHSPLADRMYALIGFTATGPLTWPPEWASARIANPDAPLDRHAIRVETPQGPMQVMPVLVASRTQLKPGESFFSVMDVRLLAVQRSADGNASVPLRRDGQLVWFDANRTESYLRQLGGNTRYTIHPEETAADNVAYLVSGRTVVNPPLLERFRQVLLTAQPQKKTP